MKKLEAAWIGPRSTDASQACGIRVSVRTIGLSVSEVPKFAWLDDREASETTQLQ
jgi:hypothetical protein